MEFKLALLAVKNVNVSKQFYSELFDQKVILDLGKNLTFSGGFAIQEDFAWLTDLPSDSVMEKSNNMELYFEVDDFETFIQKIKKYGTLNMFTSLRNMNGNNTLFVFTTQTIIL